MSKLSSPIRGIVPPIVTPLNGHDELDHEGLERLVSAQIAAGVAGLFVLGTTGEGPGLSYRLRYEMVERTCELVADRIPVLVGVTDTSLKEAVELANFSLGAGATAIVAAAPYYFPVGQLEITDFLLDLADQSQPPLFIYNMPSCVKISLSFDSVARLTGHANICGIKDSSGDLPAYKKLLELRATRPDWTFLIGPELLTAESVLLGGDGGVSGGANLHPTLFVEMYDAAARRDQAAVDHCLAVAVNLSRIYTVAGDGMAGYLRGLKCAMSIAGICSGKLASPFRDVADAQRTTIANIVDELKLASVNHTTST